MARDTSGSTVTAFLHRGSKKSGKRSGGVPRYQSTGEALYVWGNKVAEWRKGNRIKLCDRGYQTLLTKNTLNAILDKTDARCRIAQKKGDWHVYCRKGSWATGQQRTGPWPSKGCITVKVDPSEFSGSRRRRR
jgi:hypothetical protein